MGTMVREDGTVFDDSVADLLETFPVENYPWFSEVSRAILALRDSIHAQVLFLNGLMRKFPNWTMTDAPSFRVGQLFGAVLNQCENMHAVAVAEQWSFDLVTAMQREVELLKHFAIRCRDSHETAPVRATDLVTAKHDSLPVEGSAPAMFSRNR